MNTLEYEAAFFKVCEDISLVTRSVAWPAAHEAQSLARSAERHLAAALEFAAGQPEHPHWGLVFESLDEFVALCARAPEVAGSPALRDLQAFLAENAAAGRRLALAG